MSFPDPSPPTSFRPAYYRQLGPGMFVSTEHAQGAWSADHQHMAPLSGLLVQALESCTPRGDLIMSRVAFDIFGSIPTGEVAVSARVIRPGRTIELVEAEAAAGGRTVVRATAWRLAASDTSAFAGNDLAAIPGPEEATPLDLTGTWTGGFMRSVESRAVGQGVPGRSTVWLRTTFDLVEGVPTSPTASIFALIDTANGVAARAHPRDLLFSNTDLTVHLFRQPAGGWLGLRTEVSFGPDGLGLTAAVLYDVAGPIGRSAQTLTLRPVR